MKTDEDLVFCDDIKMKTKDSLETRCMVLEKYISNLPHKFTYIFVEEPYMMFAGGKTTARTMAKLQRFNGMCCYMLLKLLNVHPILIPANKARKTVGIVLKRGTCTKTKVIKFVEEKYDNFQVWYTRHGNPKPGTDDRADSVVVALAGIKILGIK
tara:strand:- start:239 stop:703 length:465 start_codon:yes stop_codon:yes gene_type:complete